VTGVPNSPGGRVYPGYRNVFRGVERMEGIRVVRVWTYVAPNRGTVRRSLDYLSFMTSALAASLVERRPSVVVGTSPQLLAAQAAACVAAIRRVPFVLEVRDLWPESLVAVGAGGGPMVRALARMADGLYRRAVRIVCVTESFRKILSDRGVPADKIAVVRNGVDLSAFSPLTGRAETRARLGVPRDEFVVAYVGTMGLAHGLETVLDAADLTRGEPIRYLLVGDGAREAGLKADASRRGLSNVTFVAREPRENIPAIIAAADGVLVHLRDAPLFSTVIPSKIFEAMAVSRPIIHAVRGESAEIVERAGAGITVAPGSPDGIAAAVRKLRADPALARRLGENGRRAVELEFGRREAALSMLRVLEDAARGGA
jgi:glycosyltransferase involved in cell wall biosynthesis